MGGFALVALEGFIGGHKDRATAQRKRRVGNLIALQQAVELKRYIDGFVTLIRVALLPISYRTEWGKGGVSGWWFSGGVGAFWGGSQTVAGRFWQNGNRPAPWQRLTN